MGTPISPPAGLVIHRATQEESQKDPKKKGRAYGAESRLLQRQELDPPFCKTIQRGAGWGNMGLGGTGAGAGTGAGVGTGTRAGTGGCNQGTTGIFAKCLDNGRKMGRSAFSVHVHRGVEGRVKLFCRTDIRARAPAMPLPGEELPPPGGPAVPLAEGGRAARGGRPLLPGVQAAVLLLEVGGSVAGDVGAVLRLQAPGGGGPDGPQLSAPTC